MMRNDEEYIYDQDSVDYNGRAGEHAVVEQVQTEAPTLSSMTTVPWFISRLVQCVSEREERRCCIHG